MNQDLARTILGNIGDGIVSVDASHKVIFANPMACSILGLSNDDLVGSNARDSIKMVIYDENCSKVGIDPLGIAMATGEGNTYSTPMVVDSVKDRMVYVEDTVSPIKNSDGDIIGAVMVFRDVTEEVQMATLLKIANERYKVLFDSIKTGVAVYESADGETFKIVDFNPAAEKLEGARRSDIIGKSVVDVFPGIVALGLLDAMKKVWLTGLPERLPCAMYEDAFRKGWRDNYVYKLPTGEVVAVYDDVTQKRDMAERVSESISRMRDNETRLRGMFEHSAIGVVIAGGPPDFKITQANDRFCEFIGYPREELVGKLGVFDFTYPDDIPPSRDAIMSVRNAPAAGKPVEIVKRYVRKDGTIKWGSAFLSRVEHSDGRVEHLAQVMDITDTRRLDDEKKLLAAVVSELNATDVKSRNAIAIIMGRIKEFAGLDAVAVRLPERIGNAHRLVDYPFYFHDGFDAEFVAQENSLCMRDANGDCCKNVDGSLELSCVCGSVLLGKFDPSLPFFTKKGSFWTNSLTKLVSEHNTTSFGRHVRGTCWKHGYESIAIIPFVAGETTVGAMLLNARRSGAFDQRMVAFLEEVGGIIGVAVARIQMRSDIDESRHALARANGILSVECDVARSMATGMEGGLDAVLRKAGRKLKARWLCVVVIGDGGIMGKWTDEGGSSINSIDEVAKLDAKDIAEVRKWVVAKEAYIGDMDGMPPCLAKISKPVGGHWMAIPVAGDGPRDLVGAVLVSAKNGRRWSKDEHDAMVGLSTLLCILAKGEKNRDELSRRIEQTINEMSGIIGIPNESLRGKHA